MGGLRGAKVRHASAPGKGHYQVTDQLVRDIVLPLATLKLPDGTGNVPDHIEICGTCFLIGRRGFALTAAHVIDQLDLPSACALIVRDGGWYAVRVAEAEKHPQQDVAIIRFAEERLLRPSWFRISGEKEYGSADVTMWGYPDHITREVEREVPDTGVPRIRPDLIFFRGYVRRRIPRPLPFAMYVGDTFYETSIVGGQSCSGSPVLMHRPGDWKVVGVYVGENVSHPAYAVGYAATTDRLADWTPRLLGVSLLQECGEL
jgi:hypothetical protein